MIVIPAIDLKDGQCVRLFQGKRDAVTTYSKDPAAIARRWESCGAELIHIVDLDGAFSGNQKNMDAVMAIRKTVKIPLQVGGGIRSLEAIKRLFSWGIDRIIMGTVAVEDPEFVKRCCEEFPGKILIGIDARDGVVAIRGWETLTTIDAGEMARRLETAGAAAIVYTDIVRDGTLSGPNIEATKKMVECVNIPIIAAGGVSCIEDIKYLMKIQKLWGVITGKALYTGSLDLKEAIRVSKSTAEIKAEGR